MIKVACSGYPVNQHKYQVHLNAVELISLSEKSPKTNTLEKWIKGAASQFEFIVCAPHLIPRIRAKSSHHGYNGKTGVAIRPSTKATHDFGDFKNTFAAAHTLKSRIIFFPNPSSLSVHPDTIRKIQTVFRQLPREEKHFIWEPPGHWPPTLVHDMEKHLHVTAARNPLSPYYRPLPGVVRYFRIGAEGKTFGSTALSDKELRKVRLACDRPLCYVIFNNGPTAFQDAVRFRQII